MAFGFRQVFPKISRVLSFAILSSIVLTGCQTAPTKFETLSAGKWDGRILLRDLRQSGKSQVVNATLVAQRPSSLRVELVTSLGQHLATIVKNSSKLQVLVVSEKSVFEGPSTPAGFERATGVALDPQLLVDVLFDQKSDGFSCETDKKGYLSKCESEASKISVEWLDREASRKKVALQSPQFTVQMQLQGFSKDVQATPQTFELVVPPGFQRRPLTQKR